jgi:hypothetical protein
MTIIGGGHTIDGSAFTSSERTIATSCEASVDISNVTFQGGGHMNGPVISLGGASSNFENITFQGYVNSGISGNSCTLPVERHSVRNVLFESAIGYNFHFQEAGSAINAFQGASFDVSNVEARTLNGGNAAFNAWSNGSITFEGCLSHDKIFPRLFSGGIPTSMPGTITDNSTGPCSGTIGNGDQAGLISPEPQPGPCGLPARGFLKTSATYTLTSDCQQTGVLLIPAGLTVTINGNGRRILNSPGSIVISNAGDLTIRRVRGLGRNGGRFVVGFLPLHTLRLEDSVLSGFTTALSALGHNVIVERTRFERNSSPDSAGTSASSALQIVRQSVVTVRDSQFIGNSGGSGPIFIGRSFSPIHSPPRLRLEGCITFEANSPINTFYEDAPLFVIDASTGSCAENVARIDVGGRQAAAPSMADKHSRRTSPASWTAPKRCEATAEVQALPMGVVACVFRWNQRGEPILQVYGVNERSVGFHMLTVRQSQLDAAVGETIIGVSADGRALVVMWADRNVTVKVGPDAERKILHMTFAGGLAGTLIDFRTTYGEAPGLPYLHEG